MNIPATMKAAVIDEYGGSDNLAVKTLSTPTPEPNEILIRVASAGIGSWEADEREGKYEGYFGTTTAFPYILGWDGAGTVAAVGSSVDRFKVGDRVYAASTPLPRGGFYAEYTVVDQQYASHIPRGVSMEQAGAMAWDGLADHAIDGRTEDIVAAARQFAPEGLDAVLLTAGGKAADQALHAVRAGGRVGWPNGVIPEPNPPAHVRVHRFDGDRSQNAFAELNRLIESGPFKIHIAHTFPLDQASMSHEALATHFVGKLALILDS